MFCKSAKRKPSDCMSEGFSVPENVVPKVKVELTQGHPYRFLSSTLDIQFSFMATRLLPALLVAKETDVPVDDDPMG